MFSKTELFYLLIDMKLAVCDTHTCVLFSEKKPKNFF